MSIKPPKLMYSRSIFYCISCLKWYFTICVAPTDGLSRISRRARSLKINVIFIFSYFTFYDCQQKARKQIAESVSNLLISATYNYTVVDHEIVLITGDSVGDGINADPFMRLIGGNGETPFQLVTSGGMLYADENEQGA